MPEGSTGEGLVLSRSELSQHGAVNYRVKVTNTGKMGGGVSVLAFVTSDVRQPCVCVDSAYMSVGVAV